MCPRTPVSSHTSPLPLCLLPGFIVPHHLPLRPDPSATAVVFLRRHRRPLSSSPSSSRAPTRTPSAHACAPSLTLTFSNPHWPWPSRRCCRPPPPSPSPRLALASPSHAPARTPSPHTRASKPPPLSSCRPLAHTRTPLVATVAAATLSCAQYRLTSVRADPRARSAPGPSDIRDVGQPAEAGTRKGCRRTHV